MTAPSAPTAPAADVRRLSSVYYVPPLVNPAPGGLYAVTSWTEDAEPNRWLSSGVVVRPQNYGGQSSFGVWAADWCASPDELDADDVKAAGARPAWTEPFDPVVVWASDACDPSEASQDEIRHRVQQNLRLMEQPAVEREFAARLLLDTTGASTPGAGASTPGAGGQAVAQATDIVGAVSVLEAALADTNTLGVIHASPVHAAFAARFGLIQRTSTGARTPLGHLWCFGGGYAEGLGSTLVATSPCFGWRAQVSVREAFNYSDFDGEWLAIAERAVLVAYEAAVGAVAVSG